MPGTYSVQSFNDAEESENRIHSDEMAQRLGFEGALVAGVVVFGHMTYLPIKTWGREWLTDNQAEVKFLKPAYDGQLLEISYEQHGSGNETKCHNPSGVLLAPMTDRSGKVEVNPSHKLAPSTSPIVREEISWHNLIVDQPAPAFQWFADRETNDQLCDQLRDDQDIYIGDKVCVHPFWILRQCNAAFSRSFILPAWLHVGSNITFHKPLLVDQDIEVRMVPVKKWQRKGHEFVTLYISFIVDGEVYVEVDHTSIFKIASPE